MEITINDNQGKSFDYYHRMLKTAFSEINRVLKSGKYLTVTFHNTNIRIYNSIHRAAVLAGFDLEKVVYQPPARASAKQLRQPYGSAKGDYYIRFKKPKQSKNLADENEIDKERYERIIIDCVKKVIAERREPTPYSYIINSYSNIYDELSKNGYLFSAATDIEKILKKYPKIFVKIPKTDAEGKTIGHLWWFKNPLSIPFIQKVPLSERVEKAVLNVLNKEYQITFDRILQEIFIRFPNALTPDTLNIYNTLQEYAEKVKEGKWRLKPRVQERLKEHDRIIEYLCELGEKAGYQVYGDIHKRRKQLTFDIPEFNLRRIQEIDALWYKDNAIYYEFEVENTTGIIGAMERGTNIENVVNRIILIPDERENLLFRVVREPGPAERIAQYKWKFIWYDDFVSYYHTNKHKNRINASDLERLYRTPKSTRIDQLDTYMRSEDDDH